MEIFNNKLFIDRCKEMFCKTGIFLIDKIAISLFLDSDL